MSPSTRSTRSQKRKAENSASDIETDYPSEPKTRSRNPLPDQERHHQPTTKTKSRRRTDHADGPSRKKHKPGSSNWEVGETTSDNEGSQASDWEISGLAKKPKGETMQIGALQIHHFDGHLITQTGDFD